MTYALLILLSLHAILADTRTLEEGEALAFEAVFGTSNMQKLQEIERDPAAYWEEREKALQDEVISHLEFCAICTEDAKACIKEAATKDTYHPWFCQDPNAIEEIITSKIPKDHPAYPTVVALFTTAACDHLHDPDKEKFTFMATKEGVIGQITKYAKAYNDISRDLNARMRWVIRDKARFSIFDSLVLLSKKQYLCGAPPADQRMDFFAHQMLNEPPIFSGFSGPIRHDTTAHALFQYLYECHFRKHGVSYHKYFRQCWNKKTLVKNNIIGLAQDAIGCFYNFHESPSVNHENTQDLASLISFESRHLTDFGFCDIVPYFTNQDADFNWHTQKIKPCDLKHTGQTNDLLLEWKRKACDGVGQEILRRHAQRRCLWRCTLL